jgi:hypothetical protein
VLNPVRSPKLHGASSKAGSRAGRGTVAAEGGTVVAKGSSAAVVDEDEAAAVAGGVTLIVESSVDSSDGEHAPATTTKDATKAIDPYRNRPSLTHGAYPPQPEPTRAERPAP